MPPATKGTGTGLTLKEPVGNSCWPNALKLSDRGWRGQDNDSKEGRTASLLFAGARC